MRDGRNYILVKGYQNNIGRLGRDMEDLTKCAARCSVKRTGIGLKLEVYCRKRYSKVYNEATRLGFMEEIGE